MSIITSWSLFRFRVSPSGVRRWRGVSGELQVRVGHFRQRLPWPCHRGRHGGLCHPPDQGGPIHHRPDGLRICHYQPQKAPRWNTFWGKIRDPNALCSWNGAKFGFCAFLVTFSVQILSVDSSGRNFSDRKKLACASLPVEFCHMFVQFWAFPVHIFVPEN